MKLTHSVIALAALVLLAGTVPLHHAYAASAFQVGVCIHVGHNVNPPAGTQAALQSLTSFRDEASWNRIEQQPGILQLGDKLKDLDALIDLAVSRGQRPLVVLDYGSSFYDGGGLINSPSGIAAFTRYARFVVRHFKGRVDQFEIWNEWNIGGGVAQTPRPKGSAASYEALLHAVYPAIKAENPSAVVVGGAVAKMDEAWIDSFGQAGGFAFVDGFSVHPYNFSEIGPRYARGSPERSINWLERLKATVDHFARGRTVSIYVTEIGWPTHDGPHGVPEAAAAAYAQRFYLLARSRPWIAGVWWYDLFDDGTDPGNREHHFGLLYPDGQPKAAYGALLKIAPILKSPYALAEQTGPSGEMVLSGRQADGKQVTIAWLPTDDFLHTSPWSAGAQLVARGYSVAQSPDSQNTPILGAMPTLLVK
jgi:polysaccharide biosynthesis protein PslG